ncbi:MAG TPA: glutamyl-tRNA reductase [Candidatus Limnocylindrales bacterium]|nr:glutamyl-tRNA reductase [Candidatus Limnocylindrales bacterium]
MTLLVVGVNHRSAPARVLDQMGLTPDEAEGLSADLAASDVVAEAMVLATCNRVEVYADVTRFHPAVTAVAELMAKWTGCDRATLIEHSYVHFDSSAVAHLFSVAAGLDSMVVGEAQILGQVRASLARGQDSGTAGRVLNGVGQRALRAGKRVHAETGIDRSGVSVVSVGLDAAAAVLGDLAGRRVLVVGAGSMGALAASTLVARGVSGVLVANRTTAVAERVAAGIPQGRAIDLAQMPAALAEVDLAICCTGAQDSVIDVDLARAARAGAPAGRPLVLLDLALPHDVDPEVGELPGVTRIDLAALATLPATAASEADLRAAREIVAVEVEACLASVAGQAVEPVLVSLRAHVGGVLDTEMERLRLRLTGLDSEAFAEVERAMRRAMATLLHQPTVRMKQLAAEPGGDRYAEALSALFDLDPSLPASVVDPSADLDPGSDAPHVQGGPR